MKRSSKRSRRTSHRVERNAAEHRWFRLPDVSDDTSRVMHPADMDHEVERMVFQAEKAQERVLALVGGGRTVASLTSYHQRMSLIHWVTANMYMARAETLLRLVPADGRDVPSALRARLRAAEIRDNEISAALGASE